MLERLEITTKTIKLLKMSCFSLNCLCPNVSEQPVFVEAPP